LKKVIGRVVISAVLLMYVTTPETSTLKAFTTVVVSVPSLAVT